MDCDVLGCCRALALEFNGICQFWPRNFIRVARLDLIQPLRTQRISTLHVDVVNLQLAFMLIICKESTRNQDCPRLSILLQIHDHADHASVISLFKGTTGYGYYNTSAHVPGATNADACNQNNFESECSNPCY